MRQQEVMQGCTVEIFNPCWSKVKAKMGLSPTSMYVVRGDRQSSQTCIIHYQSNEKHHKLGLQVQEPLSSKMFPKSTHCSKSSFFVQKFNLDFPRKLSIFWVKNSRKCCGLGFSSCLQLWFHEKNCQKKIWLKNSWKLTFRIVCSK